MKKHEILEAMEINNHVVKEAKKTIANLKKVREYLEKIDAGYDTMKNALIDIDREINLQEKVIERNTDSNKRFKKQVKLLEQLEALETEIGGELPGQTEIGDQN